MNITTEMIKHLREITGAGRMDCKKALQNCNGDEELAKDYLRNNPYNHIICGKLPYSRTSDCFFCKKEVCENTYDDESEACKNCLIRKCMKG